MRYEKISSSDKNYRLKTGAFLKNTSDIKELNHPSKETLDIFGRLLYAIAMADGQVQKTEIKVLESVIENDEWAKTIELSFKKGPSTDMAPQTMFLKNMRVFFASPVNDHYPYFLNLMEKIAGAHNGVIDAERKMINQFKGMYKYTLEANGRAEQEYDYYA